MCGVWPYIHFNSYISIVPPHLQKEKKKKKKALSWQHPRLPPLAIRHYSGHTLNTYSVLGPELGPLAHEEGHEVVVAMHSSKVQASAATLVHLGHLR